MPKRVIFPPNKARPASPYSPATEAGGFVFISGQVAFDAAGKLVGKGDVRRQTEVVLDNVKGAIEAAGGTMDDIAKVNVYLTDPAHFQIMNEVYRRYFSGEEKPARATVIAVLATPDFLVEIEAIGYLGS